MSKTWISDDGTDKSGPHSKKGNLETFDLFLTKDYIELIGSVLAFFEVWGIEVLIIAFLKAS